MQLVSRYSKKHELRARPTSRRYRWTLITGRAQCFGRLLLVIAIVSGVGAGTNAIAQAPAFAWAAQIGGDLDQGGASIAVDTNGNAYLAGVFAGTATFGSTALTTVGNSDSFLAKYDLSGNLLWVKSCGGEQDDFIFGNAVDKAGNCYISGVFEGAMNLGGITLTNDADPFGQIGFIAKYDTSGNVLWAKQISGTENNAAIGIAVDNAGNVFLTGDFSGTANFDSTSLVSGAGNNNIFVAKYDTQGNLLWARQAGGADNDAGLRIAVDSVGNCFVTGIVTGQASFGTNKLTSINLFDTFLAKYSATGSVSWVRLVQRTTTHWEALDVAADLGGNCYLTGDFTGVITLGGQSRTSTGASDIFLAKFGPGGSLLWLQRSGGSLDDRSFSVAIDSNTNAYIAGLFAGTAAIGGTNLTSLGYSDIFIAKYNSSGTPIWAVRGGGSFMQSATDLTVDSTGHYFVTGAFTNDTTLGSITLHSIGGTDAYIARLGGPATGKPTTFVLDSLAVNARGHLQFQITGGASSSTVLQASTNLVQWIPVATNTFPADGTLTLEDPAGTALFSRRFYRLLNRP